MGTVWLGYLGGAFFLYAAYKSWKDPFNLFDDIDDWDDVTDENRSQFNQKRLIAGGAGLLMGLGFFVYAEELTSKFNESVFDVNAFMTPMTVSDYDCDDVAEQAKTQEFRNGFGAVTTVIVVRDSVEIERTETKLSCQMTALLSTGNEVSMTAGFEEIDGEIYIRSSIDD